MATLQGSASAGQVASIHLHPGEPGAPMTTVAQIELVAGEGIVGEPRYFRRRSSSGEPARRQLSLIAREEIAEHAATLGLQSIAPGRVRANLESTGIELVPLIGRQVRLGTAVVEFYEPRTPCHQMDAICEGLRALMENGRQGVMAIIVQSGTVSVGDRIEVISGQKVAS